MCSYAIKVFKARVVDGNCESSVKTTKQVLTANAGLIAW